MTFNEIPDSFTNKGPIHSKSKDSSIPKSQVKIQPENINKEIIRFIRNIPEEKTDSNMMHSSMESGNCAVFAISLQEIFKKGQLVAVISEIEPEKLFHVYLKINDKYYDVNGERTQQQIISYWNEGVFSETMKSDIREEYDLESNEEIVFTLMNVDKEEALDETDPDYEVQEYIKILKSPSRFLNLQQYIFHYTKDIPTIPAKSRPSVTSSDLEGMSDGYKHFKTIGKIKFYKDSSGIVAKINNKEVGYVTKLPNNDTDLTVATDFQQQGIGTHLYTQFLTLFPDMISKTGGLTPNGLLTFKSTLKQLWKIQHKS